MFKVHISSAFVATHNLVVVFSAWFVAHIVVVSFGIVEQAWVEFL